MQITGSQFTKPRRLMAMTSPRSGLSGECAPAEQSWRQRFQLHFSSNEVNTPATQLTVLIAMNPAALKETWRPEANGY